MDLKQSLKQSLIKGLHSIADAVMCGTLSKPKTKKTNSKLLLKVTIYKQLLLFLYSRTCLKRSLKKKTKIGFQDQLLLNAGPRGAFCNTFDLH